MQKINFVHHQETQTTSAYQQLFHFTLRFTQLIYKINALPPPILVVVPIVSNDDSLTLTPAAVKLAVEPPVSVLCDVKLVVTIKEKNIINNKFSFIYSTLNTY